MGRVSVVLHRLGFLGDFRRLVAVEGGLPDAEVGIVADVGDHKGGSAAVAPVEGSLVHFGPTGSALEAPAGLVLVVAVADQAAGTEYPNAVEVDNSPEDSVPVADIAEEETQVAGLADAVEVGSPAVVAEDNQVAVVGSFQVVLCHQTLLEHPGKYLKVNTRTLRSTKTQRGQACSLLVPTNLKTITARFETGVRLCVYDDQNACQPCHNMQIRKLHLPELLDCRF